MKKEQFLNLSFELSCVLPTKSSPKLSSSLFFLLSEFQQFFLSLFGLISYEILKENNGDKYL